VGRLNGQHQLLSLRSILSVSTTRPQSARLMSSMLMESFSSARPSEVIYISDTSQRALRSASIKYRLISYDKARG
jgi:hypothetical protein